MLLIFDSDKFTRYVDEKTPKAEVREKNQLTVVRSHNSSSSTLKIKPSDYQLSLVRKILTKQSTCSNAKIDKTTINKFWAQHVVEFIALILQDIFMLNLSTDTNNDAETPSTSETMNTEKHDSANKFSKKLNITGTRDVFLGRKQTKKITNNSLAMEMLDSRERFNNALEIQLKIAVQVSANETFDGITIDFEDLIKTKKNNSFKTFLTNFDQNLNNLLKICFVHKSVNSSNLI